MDLAKKREEVIALHKTYESVPESPWSPQHPTMKASIDRGDALLSERPIAFLCDDEVVVVGDCVGKIVAALAQFLEDVERYEARANREPAVFQAVAKARRIVDAPPVGELRLHQQHWNAVAFALGEVGIKVILTDGSG